MAGASYFEWFYHQFSPWGQHLDGSQVILQLLSYLPDKFPEGVWVGPFMTMFSFPLHKQLAKTSMPISIRLHLAAAFGLCIDVPLLHLGGPPDAGAAARILLLRPEAGGRAVRLHSRWTGKVGMRKLEMLFLP